MNMLIPILYIDKNKDMDFAGGEGNEIEVLVCILDVFVIDLIPSSNYSNILRSFSNHIC